MRLGTHCWCSRRGFINIVPKLPLSDHFRSDPVVPPPTMALRGVLLGLLLAPDSRKLPGAISIHEKRPKMVTFGPFPVRSYGTPPTMAGGGHGHGYGHGHG